MLSFNKRDAFLGGETKGKVKTVDGKERRLLTFSVENFDLDENELNSLLGDPHAHRSLYNDTANGTTPFLKCIKALELQKGIKGAYLAITFGLDRAQMVFASCDLSKIKLVLGDDDVAEGEGGKTKLSCRVTTAPTLDDTLGVLFEQFGKKVEVEIRGESPGAQQDIPLNRHGVGELSTPSDTKADARKDRADRTRVLSPGQAESEEETQRQLSEALRGLEGGEAKKPNGGKRGNRSRAAH